MPFVSITRLHLASIWSFPRFLAYSFASARQARRAAGFHGGWLANDAERAFWTCTIWDHADAMRAFRHHGTHMTVMPKLLRWCDEAAYAHWEQPDTSIPSADIAYERLAKEGALSKVHMPSPRQCAGERVGRATPRIVQQLTPTSSPRRNAVS